MRRTLATLSTLLTLAPALGAAAQPQHTEGYAERPAARQLVLTFSGGATINSGNTRSVAANAGWRFALKRTRHMFQAEATGTLGFAATRDAAGEFDDLEANARNIAGRVRYDLFLTDDDALFVALLPRNDTFAGLDLRLQTQVGYMRNVFQTDDGAQRLWGEAGYDVTYDDFHPDPLFDMVTGERLPGDQVVHSARVFVGYDNHVTETLTVLTGLETLIDLEDAENTRLAWISEVRARVSSTFQLGINFALRWDNLPVPGTDELDTTTVLNLLYTVDLSQRSEAAAE